MTLPMKELSRLLKSQELAHGGNPVSTWMADSLEAKSPSDDGDRVRPVKPDRGKTGKRIDGMVTLLMSIDGRIAVQEIEAPPADPFFLYGEG
jgi:phage terminase large subunit-like protein